MASAWIFVVLCLCPAVNRAALSTDSTSPTEAMVTASLAPSPASVSMAPTPHPSVSSTSFVSLLDTLASSTVSKNQTDLVTTGQPSSTSPQPSSTSPQPSSTSPQPSSTSPQPATTTMDVTTTAGTRFDFESSDESFESGEVTPTVGDGTEVSDDSGTPADALAMATTTDVGGNSWGSNAKSPAVVWPWMLFILNGNVTVANRRQRDLGTYLRLNLAARLDADYNDVAINKILLTPMAVLANISVEPSHLVVGGTGAAGLEALGRGNVTLLELSGHEFQVDRIIRFDEAADQRGMISSMEMSTMTATVGSEVTVYGAVGAVFLFLLVALLLGLSFSNPCKVNDDGKYLGNSNFAYDRDQLDQNYSEGSSEWRTTSSVVVTPPVIYTEQLARQMGSGYLTPGRFIPSRPSTPVATTLAELHHYNNGQQPEDDDRHASQVSPSS